MKNNVIEDMFNQFKSSYSSLKINDYFIEKYPKNPDILSIYFEKMGAQKLISYNDNLEKSHHILKNSEFFKYFKECKLSVLDIIKIMTVYEFSDKYHIDNIKKEESLRDRNLIKIKESYNVFIESTKNLYDFELWYNEKSIQSLSQVLSKLPILEEIGSEDFNFENIDDDFNSLLNFKILLEKYYKDLEFLIKNKRSLRLNEKNIRVNYFIRELVSIYTVKNKIKIPNKIIIILLSVLFDVRMEDAQLKNIIKNSNNHFSNTNYTIQYTTKENGTYDMEYIKTKNSL